MKIYMHEGHDHGGAGGAATPEERLALLKYMLTHNAHHAEELHELAHGTEGEAHDLLHAAVDDLLAGNEKLRKAIELLEK